MMLMAEVLRQLANDLDGAEVIEIQVVTVPESEPRGDSGRRMSTGIKKTTMVLRYRDKEKAGT